MGIYSVDCGHNCYPDIGAVGIRKEDELTKEVGQLVINKLKDLGNTVIDCTPYGQEFEDLTGSLDYRIKKANKSKSELHICIHFNAGGGHGTEVYAISEKGKEYADKVLKEIVALGYANRGIKTANFYVIKNTTMPCILIETAFIDNQGDMDRYNADNLSSAIVKGITGQLPILEPKVNPMPIPKADANVLHIQHVLNMLKIAKLDEDGIMGTLTKNAIMKFQQITHTEQDGVVGQNTMYRFNEILSKPFVDINHRSSTFAVMYIQWRVGVINDGVFGIMTNNAVKEWQKKNGLVADGQVGNMTWDKLLG